MKKTRVSIILTYFDYARFIGETVKSIIAQKKDGALFNLELVIVEDGGERIEPAALSSWRSELSQVCSAWTLRHIRLENTQGLPVARNEGFRKSTGDLIVFMDSDDCLAPEFMEETIRTLHEFDCDGVYTHVQTFGDWDYLWEPDVDLVNLLCGVPGPATFLMKREVVESIGGFAPTLPYNCDHSFWIDAIAYGFKFKRVDKPLFLYRKHSSSMSTVRRNEWWRGIERLSNHHSELYHENLAEILTRKERQFRELEDEYQSLWSRWKESTQLWKEYETKYDTLTQSDSFRLYQSILNCKKKLTTPLRRLARVFQGSRRIGTSDPG
jgi:glycosyltransferase involved in cell wall biosynthesis